MGTKVGSRCYLTCGFPGQGTHPKGFSKEASNGYSSGSGSIYSTGFLELSQLYLLS